MQSLLNHQRLARAVEMAKTPEAQAGLASLVLLPLLPKLNSWMSQRKANNFEVDDTWDCSKEIVVVTGGSSGIGAKIVSWLERDNVKVIIIDLNPPLEPTGKNTSFYKADLRVASEIASVTDTIRNDHGDPTVLVNNAGTGIISPILEMPGPDTRRVFEVNLFAPVYLVKQFLPAMVKHNHGHIVNVSGMAAFATQACNVPYACSKNGLLSFHEGLVQECWFVYNAPLVRATVVHPSWIKTPMIRSLTDSGKLATGRL
ncbi:hypothetical protein INS49_007222 [Diaporthe citri]|uniref:uncharacterized protein n=1 Tax=Diaporthe citri TaxID=83186 RepID=UPI001C8277BC|nr:uncharacterized protein INS49_007222 [Diaporthe citri]KAG6365611.1 hypothetical protein INS49_007222 [Diaporthe citri]